ALGRRRHAARRGEAKLSGAAAYPCLEALSQILVLTDGDDPHCQIDGEYNSAVRCGAHLLSSTELLRFLPEGGLLACLFGPETAVVPLGQGLGLQRGKSFTSGVARAGRDEQN